MTAMKTTTPYVYILRDTHTDKLYIGCRFARGCNPADLGKTYFTSSKIVNPLFRADPARFVVRTWVQRSADAAIELEKTMLDGADAVMSDGYYNRACGKAIHPDDIRAGALKEHRKRSPELYASIVAQMHAKTTFEQRSKAGREYAESIRGPVLDAKMKMMRERRTAEGAERSKARSKERALANPERMSEMGKVGGKLGGPKACLVTNAQRWRCTECGMVSLAGPIGKHQSRAKHTGKERVQ